MTYFVVENCIKCKYMDCVEVCPVDCFYEGENMLVIHPTECIDCAVCEPACPAGAIKSGTDPMAMQGVEMTPELSKIFPEVNRKVTWVEVNAALAKVWPNVTAKPEKAHFEDAQDWDGKADKMKYFSSQPGRGDPEEKA